MPTPTGLLKPNDRLLDPKGRIWRVIERRGNDACYSAKIKPEGWDMPYGRRADWLLTAAWYLEHGWKVLH